MIEPNTTSWEEDRYAGTRGHDLNDCLSRRRWKGIAFEVRRRVELRRLLVRER